MASCPQRFTVVGTGCSRCRAGFLATRQSQDARCREALGHARDPED
ncbi:MAG: hypothetical protein JXC32_22080 [Anaerolineae bacterium]|nr:hypothetical protein [Anaerolineae bacterium]